MKRILFAAVFSVLVLCGCVGEDQNSGEPLPVAASPIMQSEPEPSEIDTDGYCTEEEAEPVLIDAYCEGYFDAYSGEEAGYIEVTEDTIEISTSLDDIGYYSEDDMDQLTALYYTNGYRDALNGEKPAYTVTHEGEEISEIPPEPEPAPKPEPAPEPEPAPAQTAPAPSSSTSSTDTQSVTVYVTNTGEKYHRDGCQYLSRSKNAISLSSAKASGYTPCSRCPPPQ